MVKTSTLTIQTEGRELRPITQHIQRLVNESDLHQGLCNVFVHHTSASLVISENADPTVCQDLQRFMARLVTDGDPDYAHRYEGPDDMSAHIRSVLTQTSISVPISGGRLALGTWQGIWLWEHRTSPHSRRITVTLIG